MKKLLLILLCLPMISFAQSYSLDTNDLKMIGFSSVNEISSNTYYNTIDSCNISWEVIKDSMPIEWEFSFCFPICYNIGVASGQDNFSPNEQIYLGCHIYPNGKVGSGIIQMEITTNNIYKDTITWYGTISSISSSSYQLDLTDNFHVSQIYDIFGRRVDVIRNSGIYIIVYSNNIRKTIYYSF